MTADLKPNHHSPTHSSQVVAESRAMQEVLQLARRVASSKASSCLITGENGTGKDVVARMLHGQSPQRGGPFLTINCAAIPETLLESELFGYEKGAFTDARGQKHGLVELADHGMLFLDEVGAIPQSLQAKLLRVLEQQAFRRLGGLNEIEVDVRIIAATNMNLYQAVMEGVFRQDLFYRLNVIQIRIPPLRERVEDILPLTRFFIQHFNQKLGSNISGLTDETSNILLMHSWPGNVRELRNAIEGAMVLEDSELIRAESLPAAVRDSAPESPSLSSIGMGELGDGLSLPLQERRLVVQALEKTHWNQTHAANLLHISRDALRYKMKKFHLLGAAVMRHAPRPPAPPDWASGEGNQCPKRRL